MVTINKPSLKLSFQFRSFIPSPDYKSPVLVPHHEPDGLKDILFLVFELDCYLKLEGETWRSFRSNPFIWQRGKLGPREWLSELSEVTAHLVWASGSQAESGLLEGS